MIENISNLPKDINPVDRVISLKTFQDKFIFSEKRYPALVSSWGTGKTMSLIEKIRLHCEQNPKALVLFCRKEFTDLKDSSIKDWNENTGIIVGSDRDAKFKNGSIVMFRHAEELQGNNLNNINLSAFGIEQGEEFESDEVFFKLQGRLRRRGFECFGAVIANTNGHNWIYNLWKVGNDDEYPLFESNSFEMIGVLPEKTLDDWRKLKDKKPKLYNRFVMNSWDESDTTDLIIHPEWVRNCINKPIFLNPVEIRKAVTIDVARFGDDKTIFYAIENNKCIAKEEHDKISTMETVGRAQIFANKHLPTENFIVDEIGVGGGVVDRLEELGKKVVSVNAAKKSENKEAYNIRAEVYAYGANLFESGNVSILAEDRNLQEQLSWAKYKEIKSNGVYQVEAKDDIKKRYGRSPDNADAFLNGLWGLQFVDLENSFYKKTKEVDGWIPERYRRAG